jgi:hypothetical protein
MAFSASVKTYQITTVLKNIIWITSRKTAPNEEAGRNAAAKGSAGTAASRLATGRAFAPMTAGKTVRMTIPD